MRSRFEGKIRQHNSAQMTVWSGYPSWSFLCILHDPIVPKWLRSGFMQRELETLFGRDVDLLEKEELKNPYRRAEILKTHQVIYANK